MGYSIMLNASKFRTDAHSRGSLRMSKSKGPKDPAVVDAGLRIQLGRKALEECRSVSWTKFLALMQIKPPRLSNWENGTGYPRTEMLVKMIRLFGISSDWILEGKVNNMPEDLRLHILESVAGTDHERLIRS